MRIVFAEGEFGRAVARELSTLAPMREHPAVASRGRFDELVAGAQFVALAVWRRYDALAEELGAACWRAGIPWSSAILEDRYLFCGPLVVPPTGPCYRCFARRLLVHHPGVAWELALSRAYERDPALGVDGFLPPAAGLAAAALDEDAQSLAAARGRLRRIDLLSGELVDTRVVRIHGCARCGAGEPGDRSGRFVDHLRPAVRELLR